MIRGLLILVLMSALLPANDQIKAGHQQMLKALAQIKQRAGDQNVYLGTARARQLRQQVATQSPATPPQNRFQSLAELALAELWLGKDRRSIELYQQALALLPSQDPRVHPMAGKIHFFLGVAWLRLAETANCCRRAAPESCIIPIRGKAVHSDPEGSEKAIEHFTRVLQAARPGSTTYNDALWLMNVAYMTLDRYPDQVPALYRIPPHLFEKKNFPHFENIAPELGLNTFSLAGGAIADDFDNDGDLDLMVSSADPAGQLRYWRNEGGMRFVEQTEAAGLLGLYGGLNMIHGDYNNDGFVDVLVLRGAWNYHAGRQPNSLIRNNGDGTFVDVTFTAGLGKVHYPTQTASFADYDNDGDLDLYVGNEQFQGVKHPAQLFQNQGDGSFVDVAEEAGVTNGGFAKAVIWGDYNGDNLMDLYVSNFNDPNRLYHNKGDGTFEDRAKRLGVDGPHASFPAWFWDYDQDGDTDLFVSAYDVTAADITTDYLGKRLPDGKLARLYQADGKGGFQNVAPSAGLTGAYAPMGANFGDLDNDGFEDVYLGTGWPNYEALMPNVMLHSRGGKRFEDVTFAGGFGHLQKGHAVVFADFDADGDLDVFQQMGGFYQGDRYYDALYRNPGFGGNFLGVRVVGKTSNRSAIGVRVALRVRVGETRRVIYQTVNGGGTFGGNPLRRHFGLGQADTIEALEIYWPVTGKTQVVTGLQPNQVVRVVEGAAGFERIEQP